MHGIGARRQPINHRGKDIVQLSFMWIRASYSFYNWFGSEYAYLEYRHERIEEKRGEETFLNKPQTNVSFATPSF